MCCSEYSIRSSSSLTHSEILLKIFPNSYCDSCRTRCMDSIYSLIKLFLGYLQRSSKNCFWGSSRDHARIFGDLRIQPFWCIRKTSPLQSHVILDPNTIIGLKTLSGILIFQRMLQRLLQKIVQRFIQKEAPIVGSNSGGRWSFLDVNFLDFLGHSVSSCLPYNVKGK